MGSRSEQKPRRKLKDCRRRHSGRRRRYRERDRLPHWWPTTTAFQVGRVSPGQRLVHEAFWYGAVTPTACKVMQLLLRYRTAPAQKNCACPHNQAKEPACQNAVDNRTFM